MNQVSTAIQRNEDIQLQSTIIENLVVNGDLTSLTPMQRVEYYNKTCNSLGLNPITRPFDYVKLNGKLALYARKDATEQLRKIRKISIVKMDNKKENEIYIVTAYAVDQDGRNDVSTGAVNIKGLQGDALANAMMKAETKAKRRVTLSLAGLGFLDESEVSSIKDAKTINIDPNTGEIKELDHEANIKQLEKNASMFKEFSDYKSYISGAKDLNELKSIFLEVYRKPFMAHENFRDDIIEAKDKRKDELVKLINLSKEKDTTEEENIEL